MVSPRDLVLGGDDAASGRSSDRRLRTAPARWSAFRAERNFSVLESVYHPFGVIFPEMTTDPLSLTVFAVLPTFVTAAILLVGAQAQRNEDYSIRP